MHEIQLHKSHLILTIATPFDAETMRISHRAMHAGFSKGLQKEHKQHFRVDLMGGIGGCQLYKQDTDRGDTYRLAFECGVGTTSACKGQ